MASKVSFTIRRPTATPTPAMVDSSDEDGEEGAIEQITGFDQSGAQRLREQPKPAGPLVIPALANRDWRAIARGRNQQRFVPDGAAAPTGKDGSQGGLGTRDSINSGPQATGLTVRKQQIEMDVVEDTGNLTIKAENMDMDSTESVEECEDERARRALLAGIVKGDATDDAMTIDAIPTAGNNYGLPLDETDAYKRDVVTRPDSASLADYERVPVSQFGAALLRGMGWKEGTAASRTRRGLVEPWLPAARPALLGIGAKERPAEDIPIIDKGKLGKKPDRRYVPVVRLEREGPEAPSRSGTVSRATSKSASPYPSDKDRRQHRNRGKAHDDSGYDRPKRDQDRDRRYPDAYDRERGSDRDQRRERGSGERSRDRLRETRRDERSGRDGEYLRDERERSTKDMSSTY